MTTFFKVAKGLDGLPEAVKLDFLQQVSAAHMRVVDGAGAQRQRGVRCVFGRRPPRFNPPCETRGIRDGRHAPALHTSCRRFSTCASDSLL